MNKDKKMLFEAMHKVGGMPLNENNVTVWFNDKQGNAINGEIVIPASEYEMLSDDEILVRNDVGKLLKSQGLTYNDVGKVHTEMNEDSYPPGGEEVDGVRRFGIKPFKGDDGRDRWITDEEWTELLNIRDAISNVLETKQWGDLVTSKWGFDDTFKHELYNVMGKIHKAYMDKYTPKD